MNRIKSITQESNHAIYFNCHDGTSELCTFPYAENALFSDEHSSFKEKIFSDPLILSSDHLMNLSSLTFEDCVFLGEFSLSLHITHCKLKFVNCVFDSDVSLFSQFKNTVLFENTSFINSKIDFQECSFEHFIFIRNTLNFCTLNCQKTEFYGNNVYFDEMHLYHSNVRFMNSVFSRNSALLSLLKIITDEDSKIIFRMVDLHFSEIRLHYSDIHYLEFTQCTFECNRFDFSCRCDTLILQDCSNFRLVSLKRIALLHNLNIHNFTNTGKFLVSDNSSYYIDAIKSSGSILWRSGVEYSSPEPLEIQGQLYTLRDFFRVSQFESTKCIKEEIEIIDKAERLAKIKPEDINIFISYSWKDSQIVDQIDSMFERENIKLIRDKREIAYAQSLKEYMKTVRSADYVVLVISESFLKSANCMFEMMELVKDDNYTNKILPIVHQDAGLFDPLTRTKYVKFWQEECKKIEAELTTVDPINSEDLLRALIRYERTKLDIASFISTITDLNLIVFDNELENVDFKKMITLVWDSLK